jgi:hypothetical protein
VCEFELKKLRRTTAKMIGKSEEEEKHSRIFEDIEIDIRYRQNEKDFVLK